MIDIITQWMLTWRGDVVLLFLYFAFLSLIAIGLDSILFPQKCGKITKQDYRTAKQRKAYKRILRQWRDRK